MGNSRYNIPPRKSYDERKTGTLRSSLWNGETLNLQPFKGSKEHFAQFSYGPVVSDLMSLKSPCAWTRIPKAIAYLEEVRQVIRKSGGEVSSLRGDLLSNDEYFVKHGCPSPRKVLGEAVK